MGKCNTYLSRIPYSTLVATIMCLLGVIMFCGTIYRGATVVSLMYNYVFKMKLFWAQGVQLAFVVIGVCMGTLGVTIFIIGYLATGQTQYKVYKSWMSQLGGETSCAVFLVITYILQIVWILIFCFLVVITFIFTTFWNMCDNPKVQNEMECIDFTQFYFFFPGQHKQKHMLVCSNQEVERFCKDYVEEGEVLCILAISSCLLIILGLVHYLICLSANYVHIQEHEEFQELKDLHYLTDIHQIQGCDRF